MLTTPNTDNAEHTTGLQRGIALKPWHANLRAPTINLLAQESRTLAHNAASDIKAAGSGGTVRYNRLEDSRLGLVFSDNAEPISAYYNLDNGTGRIHGVCVVLPVKTTREQGSQRTNPTLAGAYEDPRNTEKAA